MTKSRISTKKAVLCALFAALTAAFAQITVPISAIPITLSLIPVYIAGAMLGPVYGGISTLVYLLIGLCGLPVFQSFRGGAPVLLGPTGGYIIGYIFAAVITGAVIKIKKDNFILYPVAMVIGCAVCYAFGTAWYVFQSHTPILSALSACVIPFIPGDILKIAAASLLSHRLNKLIKI